MPDFSTFSLALVLTGAGVTVSATIVAAFIDALKKVPAVGAWLDAGNEPLANLVLSAGLVLWAYFATVTAPDPTNFFAAFLVWLGIVGLAPTAHATLVSIKSAFVTAAT